MRWLISFFLLILLCCCEKTPPYTSIMNYVGGTVIEKEKKLYNSNIDHYFVKVRYLDSDSIYQINDIEIPKYEYDLFNLGETIKLDNERKEIIKSEDRLSEGIEGES